MYTIDTSILRDATKRLAWLTPRERQVLRAMVDGLTVEDIAAMQYVSECTIRTQIRFIYQKLGVRSQLAAVAIANKAAWQSEDERTAALDRVLAS